MEENSAHPRNPDLTQRETAQACAGIVSSFVLWACLHHAQTFLIRIAAFVDVNGHSALIGGFCMVSLDMAPENGSTRQCSCFTLAEGYDASMEPAEVS